MPKSRDVSSLVLGILVCLFGLANATYAATYNVSTVFNIDNGSTSPFCCGLEWNSAAGTFGPINAQNGDTINLSFSFTENEALQLSGSTWQGFIFYLSTSLGAVSASINGTVTLTNYSGDVDQTSATLVTNSFGQFISQIEAHFTNTSFVLQSGSVSLTLLTGAPTPLSFSGLTLRAYATDVNVVAAPLPAALPLLTAALGGMGFLARKRRKQRVAALNC